MTPMSKIERHLYTPSPSAPLPKAAPERVEAVPAAVAGDRLAVSKAGSKAEQLRALTREMAAILEFKPRTTAQAEDWMARGEALYEDAAPRLLNGDLKALPLKERQDFMVAVRRLERFLEEAPGIIDFVAGK